MRPRCRRRALPLDLSPNPVELSIDAPRRLMETAITAVIGARLRQMRMIRGQSLREQARIIGVSPSTLSELERGVAGISLQRLQTVANELGISVSELLASEHDR